MSIVSHGHGRLVAALLDDLRRNCATPIEVLLTLNVPEEIAIDPTAYEFDIRIIRNVTPRGFGANHNAAFAHARGEYFCVLNPDVRLIDDPFPRLFVCARQPTVGVVGPRVLNSRGELQDSARPFPTPVVLIGKVLRLKKARYPDVTSTPFPDWVAGMFMLFPRSSYSAIGGFDESYFLYYEDIDVCARLRLAGYRAAFCNDAVIVHDAHRSSHHSLKFLRWHVSGILRFFASRTYRAVRSE